MPEWTDNFLENMRRIKARHAATVKIVPPEARHACGADGTDGAYLGAAHAAELAGCRRVQDDLRQPQQEPLKMSANDQEEESPPTVAADADATTIVPPPTETAPELAWSADHYATVLDHPTMPWWGKLRQRVTDFFHPYLDDAPMDDDGAPAMDDDDDGEPIAVTNASWAACFASAAPILFVAAAVALVIVLSAAWHVWITPRSPALSTLPPTQTSPVETIPPAALPSVSSMPPSDSIHTGLPAAAAPPTVTVTAPPPSPPTVTVQRDPTVPPPPADADRIFREGVAGIPGLHVVNWDVAEAGARSICGGFARGMTRAQIIDEVQRNDPTFTPWQTSGLVNVALAAYCPQYEG